MGGAGRFKCKMCIEEFFPPVHWTGVVVWVGQVGSNVKCASRNFPPVHWAGVVVRVRVSRFK